MQNLAVFFNYLHDSNSIFWAQGIKSEWVLGRTVLALVRTRWFSKPLSTCTDEAGFSLLQPAIGREGHTGRGQGDFVVCSFFRALRWCPQRHQRQIDARRVFSHERRRADVNFPPSLWQDLSVHGGSLWLQKLGASVVIPGEPHTCRVGKGPKPDIIDCFLVSTLISPTRRNIWNTVTSSTKEQNLGPTAGTTAVPWYPAILLPGALVSPGLLAPPSGFRAPCCLRVLSVVLLRI